MLASNPIWYECFYVPEYRLNVFSHSFIMHAYGKCCVRKTI